VQKIVWPRELRGKVRSVKLKLSVIIISWNVKDCLITCLRSIEANQPCCDCEIIVVDNASTDGTVDLLKREFSQVKLIANSGNKGFSAANNQAIKIAKGEYLLLLNPDTVVHPCSLDTLITFLDTSPDFGACGPKLLDADGRMHASIGYVPTFRSILYGKTIFRSLGLFQGHYRKLQTDNIDCSKQVDVEQISGAVLMVRCSLMKQIGLMDESFFLYYEDVDLCLRIRKAGWRIAYVPEAMITHTGGRSTLQVSAKKKFMLYKSLLIYLRKHKGRFPTTLFSFIFKPGVIIKEMLNVFVGTVTFAFSILLSNRRRKRKSLLKIKNSTVFILRYMWYFLFKA